MQEKIIIIDFGSHNAQIIGRRLRELNVYCEITFSKVLPNDCRYTKGVIFSESNCSTELSAKSNKFPVLVVTDVNDGLTPLLDEFISLCGISRNWTPAAFVETSIKSLKERLGDDKVILALSGGVDSSVTAALLNKAIGKHLTCIFVDHGLLRKNEFENVLRSYDHLGLNVKGIDAREYFYSRLAGVSEPEEKRKIIGQCFIDVFEQEARKLENIKWLGQGTIYPDIIESLSATGKVIKSHHNVGGLPKKMNMQLVEPLSMLFKDEVRRIGRELGMTSQLLNRHPFPGPGLGIRIQ